MRFVTNVLPAIAVMFCVQAAAEDAITEAWTKIDGSGTLRGDYYQHPRTPVPAESFFGATAEFKILPKFDEHLDGLVQWRTTMPDAFGGKIDSLLRETYLNFHFGSLDLRVGRQIVAWGRADGLNPTDNLTPQDYTVLLPLERDQRSGTPSLKVDYAFDGTLDLSIFSTFFFEPSKIALPPAPVSFMEIRPARRLSNGEIAAKLDRTGEDVDWSVSYFRGFSLLPEVAQGDAAAMQPAFTLAYDRIEVFGADIARNFGRFGFRGEVAYTNILKQNPPSSTGEQPFLYWVAGIDRTFFENLNVNFQAYGRWVPDYRPPSAYPDPALRQRLSINALIFSEQASQSFGLTSRVSDKWLNDTVTVEVLFLTALTRPASAYIRPLATYALNDHTTASLGAEVYLGSNDSQAGLLRRNSGPFFEIRYGF